MIVTFNYPDTIHGSLCHPSYGFARVDQKANVSNVLTGSKTMSFPRRRESKKQQR